MIRKKLVESFKAGLEMFAKSKYGDINLIYKTEDHTEADMSDPFRASSRKKHKASRKYKHLRVIK